MEEGQISRRSVVHGMTALASSAVFPSFAVAADATWTMPSERQFKMIENSWIPMRDGVNLAARLLLPDGSDKTPVGAVPHAGRSGRRVVSAFIATAFAQDDAEAARQQWRRVADQIRPKVLKRATLMTTAKPTCWPT